MPWFRVYAEIEIEVEARDEESAKFHAETICIKKLVGQEFGHHHNDRGRVSGHTILSAQLDNDGDEPEDGNHEPMHIRGESWSRE
jgi:hypothetical protein